MVNQHQHKVASTQKPQIHTWTVEEYRQLVKARLVGTNQPSELIAGQIIRQEPPLQSVDHGSTIKLIKAVLQRRIGERAALRSQQPITLGRYSEPKPDLVVVTGDAAKYRYHNPTPAEIALVLEVNDGVLAIDCGLKAIEYAQAGIQDYWVLDMKRWQLHVFRDIDKGRYQSRLVFNQDQSISPLAFPDIDVELRDPNALFFITRNLGGHQKHRRMGSPFRITLKSHPSLAPSQPMTPEEAETAPSNDLIPQPKLVPEQTDWQVTAATVSDTIRPVPVGVGMGWSNGKAP